MIYRVLAKTVAMVRALGMMYNTVVQSVLLYGSKSWVVTGDVIKVLEGFCHRAARRIIGMTATRREGREWEYLPVMVAIQAAVLYSIREYIRRRQAIIAKKVA